MSGDRAHRVERAEGVVEGRGKALRAHAEPRLHAAEECRRAGALVPRVEVEGVAGDEAEQPGVELVARPIRGAVRGVEPA